MKKIWAITEPLKLHKKQFHKKMKSWLDDRNKSFLFIVLTNSSSRSFSIKLWLKDRVTRRCICAPSLPRDDLRWPVNHASNNVFPLNSAPCMAAISAAFRDGNVSTILSTAVSSMRSSWPNACNLNTEN